MLQRAHADWLGPVDSEMQVRSAKEVTSTFCVLEIPFPHGELFSLLLPEHLRRQDGPEGCCFLFSVPIQFMDRRNVKLHKVHSHVISTDCTEDVFRPLREAFQASQAARDLGETSEALDAVKAKRKRAEECLLFCDEVRSDLKKWGVEPHVGDAPCHGVVGARPPHHLRP